MYEGASKQSPDLKNYTAPTVGSTIPGSATVVGIVVVVVVVVVVDLKIKLCRVYNMISLVLDMMHRFSHDIRPLIVTTDELSPSFKNRFQKSVRYRSATTDSRTLSPTGYAVQCIAPRTPQLMFDFRQPDCGSLWLE